VAKRPDQNSGFFVVLELRCPAFTTGSSKKSPSPGPRILIHKDSDMEHD